jgi:putative proteasome-type protease
VREVIVRDGEALMQQNIDPGCTFLLGGQIKGKSQRLFHIYPQGNFIESSVDTNYFQIGETKYGKPIIDRVVKYDTSLKMSPNACWLVLTPPCAAICRWDCRSIWWCTKKDALQVTLRRRFAEGDAFFSEIGRFWSAGLRRVFAEAPEVPWD